MSCELDHNATGRKDAVDFKKRLREATQKAPNGSDEQGLEALDRIRALVVDFDTKPEWRGFVTDVRHWWDFLALEISSTDGATLRRIEPRTES